MAENPSALYREEWNGESIETGRIMSQKNWTQGDRDSTYDNNKNNN